MANAVLTVGSAQKAAGDRVRLPMDFGNETLLIDGYTITSYNVTCSDVGAPTVSGMQLDYAYQLSALFTGSTLGSYNVVYTITLNDPDNSTIQRTGVLEVLG